MSNRDAVPVVKLRIGERILETASGGVYQHVNPVTGKVQASIPLAGKLEMDQAVEAAVDAFEIWRKWTPEARRDALIRLSQLVQSNADEFARLAALDGGTPVTIGLTGVRIAVEWISYYAGWADKLDGHVASTFGTRGEFSYNTAEPIGVIGIIVTWNGPLISLGMKVAPALAAGNCVVVKPSEMTPFAADLFGKLVLEAGIPPGVCGVLPGAVEAGEALVRHPKIPKITFTGGPIAARKILAACAEQLKPAVLELGGKSANLVFPDADLDFVCMRAVMGSIGILSGQGCALPTRMLIHESIYEQAIEKLVGVAKMIKTGDPFDPKTIVGPLINGAACDRVMGMIDRVKIEKSGRIVTGGNRMTGELAGGHYIEPTIIVDVKDDSEIARVEVFGPVLTVMKFSTEDEAVAMANSTEYGLAAYIQSHDLKRVHRVAERLNAGAIYVNGGAPIKANTPFGGNGLSGFGREGGKPGIEEFVRYKTVQIA
ncbi:MAG: aldehyde dehydrogenase [Hydrocarboniphaga sp.]|uniref:aldehyde dehydrogenase family protein n=1 Tax=Hydrocarboniphaga sp. TaxID=2033016 RepID=UPI00260660E2|nr:aldehyde dehydrogenase family protein [Hydrocarboniphaga sp.]MDB5969897.1 aldehyde dehydrogenase [Hydrocarboniphaga sp.]